MVGKAQTLDHLSVAVGWVAAAATFFGYARAVWWATSGYERGAALVARAVSCAVPLVYDRANYGVSYRRFQVFAVFLVMVSRIKLAKRRAATYAAAATSTDDRDDDENRSADDVPNPYASTITADDILEANYEANARFLYAAVLRLRGLWTKTAQYVSSRADVVPVPYVKQLSKLQDMAPVTPWDDVRPLYLFLYPFPLPQTSPSSSVSFFTAAT